MAQVKRFQIILTEEMVNAIDEMASREGTNRSAVVRFAVSQWLEMTHDIKVDHRLEWGGPRNNGSAT